MVIQALRFTNDFFMKYLRSKYMSKRAQEVQIQHFKNIVLKYTLPEIFFISCCNNILIQLESSIHLYIIILKCINN